MKDTMRRFHKTDRVIFDMDGVIFDSEQACLACWCELAERWGLDRIDEVFRKCIGTNLDQTRGIVENAYASRFGEGIANKLLKESSVLFHSRYDGGRLPVKPGTKELLEYLREQGVPMGLASSTRRESVEKELDAAGFLDYFETLTCGDAVRVSKPDPEIYLLACEAMRVKPEEAWAIEDSYNGIRSAHAAGLHPIMVPDVIPADDEMRKLSEFICKDLTEVRMLLAEHLAKSV